ncbi:DUF262 domain-containing protein [Pseudomonas fluorescens]|uniref:DUF262 domain-containing protein n=1 Tax=Pseudomonas fluorescens TaxID=294 RepID=A0A5E7FNC5_PSEFL|nr:DUF262 domain-containing protein [Pseudomonas fluorescens]VVO40660.1 hypothetical protein PS833_05791 [Pseudomonas fluorescens]
MPSLAHELTANKYSAERIVNGGSDNNIPALDKPFLIPIYQRLYTWEAQHVDCLLTDLWEAGQQQAAAEYFIGAVVVSPKPDDGSLELIDGQQRMTTLWLIASVLVNACELSDESKQQWQAFMAVGGAPRLDFSGREQDKAALAGFMSGWQCGCGSPSCSAECNGWLKNEAMIVARRTITNFIKKLAKQPQVGHEPTAASELQAFSGYLWSKATFVISQLHSKTDKNRFFDSMNSRGVQLEKHEILKARLLNGMPESERQVYAWAWDLCADINGYVKGSVQADLGFGRGANNIDTPRLSEVHAKTVGAKGATEDSGLTLAAILDGKGSKTNTASADGKVIVKHKSLVTFPVFLLHVLRVFSAEVSPSSAHEDVSVDHKKLIAEFDKHFRAGLKDKQQCKAFIHCLLRCRLLMDNFMIKGHVDEGSNAAVHWEITSRLPSKPQGKQSKERTPRTGPLWDSISMLQSMMYFSQDLTRAPWLTQALKDLYKPEAGLADAGEMLKALKQQDAHYAKTTLKDKALHEVLGVADQAKPAAPVSGIGTDTPNYWFYKLEYLLWEKWFNSEDSDDKASKPALLNSRPTIFRMRHVTSVEHVSPQSQKNGKITQLDRFGNLALLSVSENSSYSDKDPIEKRGAFEASLARGIIQSLKLADIFSSGGDWSDTAMEAHEVAMMTILLAAHPEQPQGVVQ